MDKLTSVFKEPLKNGSLTINNEGGYIVLRDNNEAIMYDFDNVLNLYEASIPKFKGDSLVLGLGLGLLGYNFADRCDSFSYLDINKDLIELVSPYYPNCKYYLADAFRWTTKKRYDAIFIDIHHKKGLNRESELKELYSKYKKFLKADGEISYLKIDNEEVQL